MLNPTIYKAICNERIEIFESYDGKVGYNQSIASVNEGASYYWDSTTGKAYPWEHRSWKLVEASQEEKEWYLACRAENKLVPKPINNLFPIF